MEADINFRCTIGVSAGALNGANYVSGQIGRSARINLRYRYDSRYVGLKALRNNHGIIGFDFAFQTLAESDPFHEKRFMDPSANLSLLQQAVKPVKPSISRRGNAMILCRLSVHPLLCHMFQSRYGRRYRLPGRWMLL